MNYKTLIKKIEKMESGEVVFINAINLSFNSITVLREFIELGIITPMIEELEKVVNVDYINDFLTGKSIYPQMSYIKK